MSRRPENDLIFIGTIKKYKENNKIRIDNINDYLNGQVSIDNVMFQLPIFPADIMFNESSDFQSVTLLNYGEYPTSMNPKLATWTINGVFPTVENAEAMPQRIVTNYQDGGTIKGTRKFIEPYDYCRILWDWKKLQTPLVFAFNTWGNYYYCQIKDFNFGRKDGVGNVYYTLTFVQWRELDLVADTSQKTSTGYLDYLIGQNGQSYYVVQEGDTIVSVAIKFFGECKYYEHLMEVNGLKNPTIQAGQILKFKK